MKQNPKYAVVFDLPDKGGISGSDFFTLMSDVLIGFEELNQSLLTGISSELKVVSYVEDIENGSIKIWLRDSLESISDNDIRDVSSRVPTLPFFLIKAKKVIIKCIDSRNSDSEKAKRIDAEIGYLLGKTEVDDRQQDWLQKEKWDKNATKQAVARIVNGVKKMPRVTFIDDTKEPHEIKGDFSYQSLDKTTESKSEITTKIELLSMHKITNRYPQKKWRFRYRGEAIEIDISECADYLSNQKFKPTGCFMEVVLSITQLEITTNGARGYKNIYNLKKVLKVEA